jgi:hypothetical protein
VIFLHIGKTAGTTLSAIARRHFPAERVFTYDSAAPGTPVQQLFALSPERRADVALVLGHVHYGIHEALPGPWTYITLLRDPVQRIASHYRHVLRYPEHRLHAHVVGSGMSLCDYAGSGISEELDNWQTRCVAGGAVPTIGGCTDELLDQAKENLDARFAWFGLSERFEDSIVLLRRALRWHRAYYVPLNSGSSGGEPLNAATRAEILRWNALDQELYEHARRRFEDTLGRASAVRIERRALRVCNAAYRPLLATRHAAGRASQAIPLTDVRRRSNSTESRL